MKRIHFHEIKEKQRSRDGVMNYFLSWCRSLLIAFLFHVVTSLHPPSFHRNDFSIYIAHFEGDNAARIINMILLHALITFVRMFIAEMIIGFTERIRTVSEGAVDAFPLQINISSLRTSEREHPMVFLILESRTNATVETITPASNVFDATFGFRQDPDYPIFDIRDLPPGERTISSPLLTDIRNDLIPEEIECYTIRIFPLDVPGSRELFTCYGDNAGADSYFCEHTICIEDDDDGKCYF